MESFGRNMGYSNIQIVEPRGLAGGLAFFWKEEYAIKWKWSTDRVICVKATNIDESNACTMLGCYGTPYYREKKDFWTDMKRIINQIEEPWILIGDLNEVVDEEEKWGGRSIWNQRLFLKKFMQEVSGLDLEFSGSKYTWQNNCEGQAYIRERLDWAVVNQCWLQDNPEAIVQHLAMEESDHLPILIKTANQDFITRRPFRFFKAWTSDPLCFNVVQRAWNEGNKPGMASHKWGKSIRATTQDLKQWNRRQFGFANIEIQKLEEELCRIQKIEGDNRIEHRRILEELKVQRNRWESIAQQKSREIWLREGDKNTRFFHTSLIVRKRQNQILAIKNAMGWISDRADIENYFIEQVQSHFEASHPHLPEDL